MLMCHMAYGNMVRGMWYVMPMQVQIITVESLGRLLFCCVGSIEQFWLWAPFPTRSAAYSPPNLPVSPSEYICIVYV